MNNCRHKLAQCAAVFLVLFSLPVIAADFDTLLFDATRYANTPERREAKTAARAALKDQMPDAFHAAMNHVHGDHVGLQVLVMEWVFDLPSDMLVPVLAEYIDHPREDTRRMAIYFLGFHQAPELAARVMAHLDEEKTRGAALRTLGKWKVAEARPAMEQALSNGTERQRVVAANALRDVGDPAAIPALIAALDDPVFTVRNTAARALVSFGDAAVPGLSEGPQEDRSRVGRIRQRCLSDIRGEHGPASPGLTCDGPYFK